MEICYCSLNYPLVYPYTVAKLTMELTLTPQRDYIITTKGYFAGFLEPRTMTLLPLYIDIDNTLIKPFLLFFQFQGDRAISHQLSFFQTHERLCRSRSSRFDLPKCGQIPYTSLLRVSRNSETSTKRLCPGLATVWTSQPDHFPQSHNDPKSGLNA